MYDTLGILLISYIYIITISTNNLHKSKLHVIFEIVFYEENSKNISMVMLLF